MKLHEIRGPRLQHDTLKVEPSGGIYGEFKVDVAYYYEGPSSSKHASDDESFREKHPASISVESVTVAQDIHEIDEPDKKWPKGTDARKLPGWDDTDEDYIRDELAEKLAW